LIGPQVVFQIGGGKNRALASDARLPHQISWQEAAEGTERAADLRACGYLNQCCKADVDASQGMAGRASFICTRPHKERMF